MRLFAHDLNAQELVLLHRYLPDDAVVISDSGEICNCTGCFGCWIKTPGRCVLKDGYQNMGELLAKCDEFVIISKCIYGSYSPFIRNIWDRSISYLLPYFVTRQGETHHQNRYDHHFRLSVYFYGDDVTTAEKETARELVAANGRNFYSVGNRVCFYNNFHEVGEALN